MKPAQAFSLRDETPFESILRLDKQWTSIHVKPIFRQPEFLHYKVTLADGSNLFLWENKMGYWEEWSGDTLRSRAIGMAIEVHYLCDL